MELTAVPSEKQASCNNTAVQGYANAALANYGGDFIAADGANYNIGVEGTAGGGSGSANYAVYGHISAFSAGNDYAGYFDGRTYVQKELIIGTSDVGYNAGISVDPGATIGTSVYAYNSNSNGNGVYATYHGSPNSYYAIYGSSPTTNTNKAGYFSGNVTITGTLTNPSDERLKENVTPLNSVMDKIMQLSTNTYNFKKDYGFLNLPQNKQYGFLAQNMEKVFPELVQQTVDKSKGPNNLFEYKTVNYLSMIPILTKALQEEHQQRLQTEQELAALKQRLDAIESVLSQNSSSAIQKTFNASAVAKLEQNTPNPVNQKTTISCFVPSIAKNATLVVYSSDGKQIKSFNNLTAGSNRLNIDANTLNSGVYTYVLLVDGKQVDSRQMIVTK